MNQERHLSAAPDASGGHGPDGRSAVSKSRELPPVPKLMAGKRGLVMGVANDHSIAWGIAQALHAAGAELAFTYQGEAGKRVLPLAEKLGSKIILQADVENDAAASTPLFAAPEERMGQASISWSTPSPFPTRTN